MDVYWVYPFTEPTFLIHLMGVLITTTTNSGNDRKIYFIWLLWGLREICEQSDQQDT